MPRERYELWERLQTAELAFARARSPWTRAVMDAWDVVSARWWAWHHAHPAHLSGYMVQVDEDAA